jgi:hypothetical protein
MPWIGGRDGNVIVVVAQGHDGEKRDGKKRENWPIKAKLKKERTDEAYRTRRGEGKAVTTTRKTATRPTKN